MDATALKTALQQIREHDFGVPEGVQPFTLVQAMLDHIGSTDSELRDTLIYGTLVRWIEFNPVFTPDELQHVWQICFGDDHLLYRIDEAESDGVFKRSFSALVIPLLLIRHRDAPFLSDETIREGKTRLLHYMAQEQDRRGFVPGKGWAHATAHAADALNEFALAAVMDEADLKAILSAVQGAVTNTTVYTHAEEERLVEVIDSILSREMLSMEFWAAWIESIADEAENRELPTGYARFINVKHFLQACYFRCCESEWPTPLKHALSLCLNRLLDT
ncbi:MAG: DUF2785 domain-containing protein [Anaerolineae bacterium]|nr:DUF2785 domain-containing protein [Anaerolineae bacterium]